MIINNSTDIESFAFFEFADHPHQLGRRFGKRLGSAFRQIKMRVSAKWVVDNLLQLVSSTYPVGHILSGDFIRFLVDGIYPFVNPFVITAIEYKFITANEREHTFRKDLVD